jgi:hypothetical protein
MSTFMPSNLPITAGMLLSGPGAAQVFWQWANQSYNAGFNYANRNATVPMDTAALALSYGVATGTACGMSFGLGRVVQRLQASVGGGGGGGGGGGAAAPQPLGLKLLTRGLPWLAVATAGVANVLAMRYKEGLEGITVYDEHGSAMGTSVAAGRACLTQVALTRAALPVPILLIPPFVLDGVRAYTPLGPLMARSLPARLGVELAVLSVFLQCALAPAVALFPPQGTLAASAMEPQFQGRVSPTSGKKPIAKSSWPLSSAGAIFSWGKGMASSRMPGAWRCKSSTSSGKNRASPMSLRCTRHTRSERCGSNTCEALSASSIVLRANCTACASRSARGVGRTPAPLRSNKASPNTARKRARPWLAAGCDRPSCCAARLTLRVRHTASNKRKRLRSRSLIFIQRIPFIQIILCTYT